jgi:hypothetical protein
MAPNNRKCVEKKIQAGSVIVFSIPEIMLLFSEKNHSNDRYLRVVSV